MARILVIDDETQIRAMLRRTLERAGYEVVEAPDGKEGMRLFHEKPADLVITDLIMPEMEGIQTIVELKRDFPAVKIIAISGGGLMPADSCLEAAKPLGAIHAFRKPVQRGQLLAAIQNAIGGP
ncbi:MAG: response regulator [Thermodesulfobacteriota bacterium]|nr:response regulator [Thermodesulfobacteriota bacterium]